MIFFFILVGAPIEVAKVENPTNEQVDEIHSIFCKQLKELFDEHKSKYIEEGENVNLVM